MYHTVFRLKKFSTTIGEMPKSLCFIFEVYSCSIVKKFFCKPFPYSRWTLSVIFSMPNTYVFILNETWVKSPFITNIFCWFPNIPNGSAYRTSFRTIFYSFNKFFVIWKFWSCLTYIKYWKTGKRQKHTQHGKIPRHQGCLQFLSCW